MKRELHETETEWTEKLESHELAVDVAKVRQTWCWKIWGYVRQHADSLDSERTCAVIDRYLVEATEDAEAIGQAAITAKHEAYEAQRQLRAELTKLRKRIVKLNAEIKEYKACR